MTVSERNGVPHGFSVIAKTKNGYLIVQKQNSTMNQKEV
jgi:hypothetical protein